MIQSLFFERRNMKVNQLQLFFKIVFLKIGQLRIKNASKIATFLLTRQIFWLRNDTKMIKTRLNDPKSKMNIA